MFGNTFDASSLDLDVGLVDLDRTQVSEGFGQILGGLDDEGVIVLTDFEDAASADEALDEGAIGSYIRLDEGLSDAVVQATPFTVVVVGDVDNPTSTQVASSIASEFGSAIQRAQLSVTTSISLVDGPHPPEAAAWGQEAAQRPTASSTRSPSPR